MRKQEKEVLFTIEIIGGKYTTAYKIRDYHNEMFKNKLDLDEIRFSLIELICMGKITTYNDFFWIKK